MKFELFNSRGQFSPALHLGKVMWRCTDGYPNYEKTYNIYFTYEKSLTITRNNIVITPILFVNPYHKKVFPSDEMLGITAHSCSMGINWINRICSITFLKIKHVKTTEEINKVSKTKGLSLVL